MKVPFPALLFTIAATFSRSAFAQVHGAEDPLWTRIDSRAFSVQVAWDYFTPMLDGKVLVSGMPMLARFNADGTRDASFGNTGVLTYPIPASFSSWRPSHTAVDAIGRIYLAGFYREDVPFEQHDRGFAVLRLRADGSLDGSYGAGGVAKLVLNDGGPGSAPATQAFANEGPDTLFDIALLPNGELLLLSAGLAAADFDALVLVARLTESGELDASFGDRGAVLMPLEGRGYPRKLDVVNDGGILVTGTENQRYGQQGSVQDGFSGFMFKLTAEGLLDDEFGVNGKFTVAHPLYSYTLLDTALHDSGKIIVSGARCTDGASACESLVFRVNANGTLDKLFGALGFSVQNLSSGSEAGKHVALDAAGNILVAGELYTAQPNGAYGAGHRPFLARLTPVGRLDENFVLTNLAAYQGTANDLAVVEDGALLLTTVQDSIGGPTYYTIRKFLTAAPPSSGSLSSQQQPSFSGFRVDVVDASGALVESAPQSRLLGLHGVIHPQPADLDVIANVYVVVATPRGWYLRNTAGNFVPWNARIAELAPAFTNVRLTPVTRVPVYAGRLPFAGTYRLYLGYRRADSTNVVYTDEAAALRITPP